MNPCGGHGVVWKNGVLSVMRGQTAWRVGHELRHWSPWCGVVWRLRLVPTCAPVLQSTIPIKLPLSTPVACCPQTPPLQILDWVDVCQRCDEVHVAAALVLLGVGPEPIARLAREVGYENVQVRRECVC